MSGKTNLFSQNSVNYLNSDTVKKTHAITSASYNKVTLYEIMR